MNMQKKTTTGVSGIIQMRQPLQQFLIGWEGLEVDEPLTLPGKSLIKIHLDLLLTTKANFREDKRDSLSTSDYNVKQKFVIGNSVGDRGNIFLSPSRVIRFNSFVRQIMLDILVYQIGLNHKRNIPVKQTIYEFMDDYNIDMPFDTLKKAIFRLRKRRNMACFPVGNVRSKF